MSHLRIPTEAVFQRSKAVYRPRSFRAVEKYLFTLSQFGAMQFISEGELVVPVGFVDPQTVFPGKVMHWVDYGIAHGLSCTATEYATAAAKTPVGATLHLYVEPAKNIGFYAVRYQL